NEFYDYRAKYLDGKSELHIPADLPSERAAGIRDLALRVFAALECAGLARVDFFLERGTDQVFVNEINTLPGFTPISMYAKLWEASGVSYRQLIDRLLQLAIARWQERNDGGM
ncbi:MAG: D-alanine--D-alanine ligase, partial [Chloroflexota bacterium]